MTKNILETRSGSVKPEFIRLPKQGKLCPHSGLSRAYLYQLANDGRIKTLSLRERGKARGVRLIVYDSLMGYLRSMAEGGAA
jgi:hypothetical protein